MSENLLFASLLHIQGELQRHQMKCMPRQSDLVILSNGGICAYRYLSEDRKTTTCYAHDPVPGLRFDFNYMNLQGHIDNYGPGFVEDLRKRIGRAVALDILSRTGSVACRKKDCDHKWITCPLPSHVKSSLMRSYNASIKDSVGFEQKRQDALYASGFSVHVHHENKESKKRRKEDAESDTEKAESEGQGSSTSSSWSEDNSSQKD